MSERNDFQQSFHVFGNDKQYIEIRLLNTAYGTVSGIFTADSAGADAVKTEINRMHLEKHTAYQVLNTLSDDYVTGKQLNRLFPYAKATAKDSDIVTINYIMTDFDPVRPAHTSSSDMEKSFAMERLLGFLTDMKQIGMIPAVVTDSGNGYNAYFRIDLSNTPDHVRLIKDFNLICHHRYSDDMVDFDRSVTNPARLAKLPGTWAVKGENTPDRPHRQSKILAYQTHPQPIPKSVIESYVVQNRSVIVPKQAVKSSYSGYCASGTGQTVTLPDAERYIQSHGWRYRVKDADKGTMYILDVCPFNPAHDNASAFILSFPDGRAMFKCHHNSCADRNIHALLSIYPK